MWCGCYAAPEIPEYTQKNKKRFFAIGGVESSWNWDWEHSKPEDILKREKKPQNKLTLEEPVLLVLDTAIGSTVALSLLQLSSAVQTVPPLP